MIASLCRPSGNNSSAFFFSEALDGCPNVAEFIRILDQLRDLADGDVTFVTQAIISNGKLNEVKSYLSSQCATQPLLKNIAFWNEKFDELTPQDAQDVQDATAWHAWTQMGLFCRW